VIVTEYVPAASGVDPTLRFVPDKAKEEAFVPLSASAPDQPLGAIVIAHMVEPAERGAVYDPAIGQVTEFEAGLLMTIESVVVAASAALAASTAPSASRYFIIILSTYRSCQAFRRSDEWSQRNR
jgi:hypothetical protein